jgi:hypothetical protein
MRFLLLAALSISVVGLSFAAPRKGVQKPADTSTVSDKAGADAGGAPPADRPADDLGTAPPPRPDAVDPKARASALNPRADELPDGGVALPPPDYDRLFGDIAALRGRVAALTTTLFASKVRVTLRSEGDNARISRLNVTLDDGVVFSAPARFSAEDERVVYEHAVAPGHHVLGVEVDRSDVRSNQYTTSQTTKLSIVIPEGKLVEASVELEDDSDIAEDFPDDQDGEYELAVRMRARVVE